LGKKSLNGKRRGVEGKQLGNLFLNCRRERREQGLAKNTLSRKEKVFFWGRPKKKTPFEGVGRGEGKISWQENDKSTILFQKNARVNAVKSNQMFS